jgi:hypothetical protein
LSAWIPETRELTIEESDLLSFLAKEHPNLLEQIGGLKVIGRCICGCRTVAFGKTYNDEPFEGGGDVFVSYQGRAANGTSVGVQLNIDDGRIVELEGIGWDGEFEGWPAIEDLEPG